MEETHLSLETLAHWLAGDLPHEDLIREVVSHFVACCPTCRVRYEEILRLQKDLEHWDERVVVFEGQEAPELLARLADLPFDEQLSRVRDDESFHTWGLCQLLLKESLDATFEEPSRAISLSELGVNVAHCLDDAYDPHWVLDLRAKAYAYLGNARRVLGELRSAETSFREAERFLAQSMTGNTLIEAEILFLKASLLRGQRRFDEALSLLDRAFVLYEEAGDSHHAGTTCLKKAKVLEDNGNLDQAIELLPRALELLDPEREPRLGVYGRYNLICCLIGASRFEEAQRLLPEVKTYFEQAARPLDLVRVRWVEGNIALGLGDLEPAERAFREVQGAFFEQRMGYDAALVSLDLAQLYAREGRSAELKRLAAEIMPVFESRDVQREAVAALILFQQAAEQERLSVNLLHQLAAILRRERPARG